MMTIARAATLLAAAAFAGGCNTVEGLGKDITAAGQAITKSADKTDARKDDKSSTPAKR